MDDKSRPRMGAWIEIPEDGDELYWYDVAPVWGRGLKSDAIRYYIDFEGSRPRMGAWIEIDHLEEVIRQKSSPPYGGVD